MNKSAKVVLGRVPINAQIAASSTWRDQAPAELGPARFGSYRKRRVMFPYLPPEQHTPHSRDNTVIFIKGSSGFGGNADSAETADLRRGNSPIRDWVPLFQRMGRRSSYLLSGFLGGIQRDGALCFW